MASIISILTALFSGCASSREQVQIQRSTMQIPMLPTENNNILVAYFSWSGNAKAIAEQIAHETGGDLFEIRAITPYPDNYRETTRVARRELKSNTRPELTARVSDIERYNTVFLCYPNWWGTMPTPVFTFLEAYNFSGKVIFPLVTHGGRKFGRSLKDMQKLTPDALIGDGVSVSAMSRNPNGDPVVNTPNNDVTAWLNGLGL